MRLTFQFAEDWLIFARAEDGSWWTTCCETWPEWLDAAEKTGVDPDDWDAVDALATADGAIEQHIIPRITAWDTRLSPTASVVSQSTGAGLMRAIAEHRRGHLGIPAWEQVPPNHWDELDARRAQRDS